VSTPRAPAPVAAEDWRAWVTRVALAAALAAVVGVVAAMAGIPWRDAVGAGSATVGGWYVSLATHALARALALAGPGWGRAGEWWAGPVGSLPALGVWALVAGLAAAIGGPPLLVFGGVAVVVANATFSVGALLRRSAASAERSGVDEPAAVRTVAGPLGPTRGDVTVAS
jgi:Kef-type K+ transport system membrane component KefB